LPVTPVPITPEVSAWRSGNELVLHAEVPGGAAKGVVGGYEHAVIGKGRGKIMKIMRDSHLLLFHWIRQLSQPLRAFLRSVNEPASFPLNQEEGEQDFSPVFNRAVDSADLKSVVGVVNLELLLATTAPEQIPRASLACSLLVVHADLGLAEAGRIIEPNGSFGNLLLHHGHSSCSGGGLSAPITSSWPISAGNLSLHTLQRIS